MPIHSFIHSSTISSFITPPSVFQILSYGCMELAQQLPGISDSRASTQEFTIVSLLELGYGLGFWKYVVQERYLNHYCKLLYQTTILLDTTLGLRSGEGRCRAMQRVLCYPCCKGCPRSRAFWRRVYFRMQGEGTGKVA